MVQRLHYLLLIYIIGTSLCLATGVVWGLRHVDLCCCPWCKAKQMRIMVLQNIKPSVGARGWPVTCTGHMGFGLRADSCFADRHLWGRNKQRENGVDDAGSSKLTWWEITCLWRGNKQRAKGMDGAGLSKLTWWEIACIRGNTFCLQACRTSGVFVLV